MAGHRHHDRVEARLWICQQTGTYAEGLAAAHQRKEGRALAVLERQDTVRGVSCGGSDGKERACSALPVHLCYLTRGHKLQPVEGGLAVQKMEPASRGQTYTYLGAINAAGSETKASEGSWT